MNDLTPIAGARGRDILRKRGIYVPPAYTNLRIAQNPSALLQATSVDASGKTQYHYTKKQDLKRSRKKWEQTSRFVQAIPAIRGEAKRMLKAADPRERAIAIGVTLMDRCGFRVGGTTEATGVTTLEQKHVGKRTIAFLGKSAVRNVCQVDPAFAALVRKHYVPYKPSRHDLNEFLQTFGEGFSCKDYRTFRANAVFLESTLRGDAPKTALEAAAASIHNTPTICKGNYLVPILYASVAAGKVPRPLANGVGKYATQGENLFASTIKKYILKETTK
jgi:DNA topoisomerase-1